MSEPTARAETPNDAAICACGHSRYWHSHGGGGDCEYNAFCECPSFWIDPRTPAAMAPMPDVRPYPKAKQLGRGERRYRRKIASAAQWQRIIAAKSGPCRVCKNPTTHLPAFQAGSATYHHVVPRDFHGDDVRDNIVPLCFACHELVTMMQPQACLALCASLTDAEYAYAVGRLGEGAFERVYRVTLT